MSIHKIPWYNLDECHDGIGTHQVDWASCSLERKNELIQEFNMVAFTNGYQPESKEQKEKRLSLNEICDKWQTGLFWPSWITSASVILYVGEPPLVALFLAAFLSGFLVYGASVVIGGILGCVHHSYIETKDHKAKKKKNAEQAFEAFIKGCRK